MIGLGFALFFAGYTLTAYGFSQLRGCNASFVSVLWPGANYQGCQPDSGSAPPAGYVKPAAGTDTGGTPSLPTSTLKQPGVNYGTGQYTPSGPAGGYVQ